MQDDDKEFLDNSHKSEPALELHSRAAPSTRGITAQSVQTQGEIPEEGRTEKNYPDLHHFKGGMKFATQIHLYLISVKAEEHLNTR